VVKVLNDAIKHMRKDFIPIYGDFHASTQIRDVSTGALILGFSPRIEKRLSDNKPMIDAARRFPPAWSVEEETLRDEVSRRGGRGCLGPRRRASSSTVWYLLFHLSATIENRKRRP
jgi:hypothetical protein